ncbi:hypothetical protein EMCRGX_G014326 [Ephydatia muelleri]
MNNASTSYNELFSSDKERYDKKLQCLYGLGTYCDPFGIPDQHWVDDVSKWPPVDYPSIYTYFIETPGGYTRERLKAFKSLEAYNYYQRSIQLDFECALGNHFWLQPLLEIKCPFKYRNSQPASIEDESFYLHKVGSEVTLDKKHDYYYQVQGQMAIWKKPYCYFICWTTKELIITRIQADGNFFEELRPVFEFFLQNTSCQNC